MAAAEVIQSLRGYSSGKLLEATAAHEQGLPRQQATYNTSSSSSRSSSALSEPGLHEIGQPIGEHGAGCSANGCGVIYVPSNYSASGTEELPLWVYLRSCCNTSRDEVEAYGLDQMAEENGVLLVAPEPKGENWDLLERGTLGADVIQLDAILLHVYRSFRVDASRGVLSGFSDGASEALAVGLPNGNVFTHTMAFSSGGWDPAASTSGRKPQVFISYGRDDPIFPLKSSETTAVLLDVEGFNVTAYEFQGGHVLPPEVLDTATAWFLNTTEN